MQAPQSVRNVMSGKTEGAPSPVWKQRVTLRARLLPQGARDRPLWLDTFVGLVVDLCRVTCPDAAGVCVCRPGRCPGAASCTSFSSNACVCHLPPEPTHNMARNEPSPLRPLLVLWNTVGRKRVTFRKVRADTRMITVCSGVVTASPDRVRAHTRVQSPAPCTVPPA